MLCLKTILPEGILIEGGSLWVVEHHFGDVLRFDPKTGAQQADVYGAGDHPQFLYPGGGLIWVGAAATLVGIDPKTNTIARKFQVGAGLNGGYAAGHLWVDQLDHLLELDPATGNALNTIEKGDSESCLNSITLADGAVWWSVNDTGAVYRVDPATAKITGEWQGLGQTSVAGVGKNIWVFSTNGQLSELGPGSGQIANTVNLEDPQPNQCPNPMTTIGADLWIAGFAGGERIFGFDTTTGRQIGSYDGGDSDIQDVATDGRSLWVDYYDSGLVDRYDLPPPKS